MAKYKVVIIEDNPSDYNRVKTNLKLYYTGIVELLPVPCIGEMEQFVETPAGAQFKERTLFDSYIAMLKDVIADIYIVDWELKFSDMRDVTNPKEIFKALPKNFRYRNKYWIFYSAPASNDLLAYLHEYVPSPINRDTPGKGSMITTYGEDDYNLFQKSMDKAIQYVASQKVPDWAESFDLGPDTAIKAIYYDLEEIDPLNWVRHMSVFPLYAKGTICAAWEKPYGILLFLDYYKTLKVFVFRSDDLEGFKSELQLTGGKGFYFNPIFFDDRGLLRKDFRPDVHSKTAIIQQEYKKHNNGKRIDKVKVKRQLDLLRQHMVLV